MIGDTSKLLASINKIIHVIYTQNGEVKNKSGILTSVDPISIMMIIDHNIEMVIYMDRNSKIMSVKNDKGKTIYEVEPQVLCLSCEKFSSCDQDLLEVYACKSYYWDKNSQK